MSDNWNILLIEDNDTIGRQAVERLSAIQVAGRPLQVEWEQNWDKALTFMKDRKADVVILDIYRGEANRGGERVGESVFQSIRENAFIPVIMYTALPEGLEGLTNEFVRLVPKEEGLGKVITELQSIFATRVPQMHRAIANHLDHALRDYMWEFVVKNWDQLSPIASKPEFVRLLVQRLANSFSTKGVDDVVGEVFAGEKHPQVADEKVHPAEFYVKPPLGLDPVLGDIRVRGVNEMKRHTVILWPTCDMVTGQNRMPKTEKVLCAYAKPLTEFQEYKEYVTNASGKAKEKLFRLLKNNRDSSFGASSDRFHFLPGLCDIPDLVVDFQDLDHLALSEVRTWPCLGTLRSPFAESLSVRFERYRNRIGTPDLDNELVVGRFLPAPTPAANVVDSKPAIAALAQAAQVTSTSTKDI